MNRKDLNNRYLELPHGRLITPVFMPDATFGFVRAVDSNDLIKCKIQVLVMNVFHLMQSPGSSTIKALGGLHKMCGWERPIITDSGGFQIYSLIRDNPKHGSVTKNGLSFRPQGKERKSILTPEKSIQLQLSYGADIIICLDYCTHPDDSFEHQEESVIRTIEWAKRCKIEFEKHINKQNSFKHTKPLLFAVIQGGKMLELRKQCAEVLLDIGFDGFGYGGYPFDSKGKLLIDMFRHTRNLIPLEFPMFALGIGSPENIVKVFEIGYDLFDSSLPTRDARRGRLCIFEAEDLNQLKSHRNSYIYIGDKKYIKSNDPISLYCDCLTCSNYSRAYLHHLFKRNDALYFRLASIHNLRFMAVLMEQLRGDYNEKKSKIL